MASVSSNLADFNRAHEGIADIRDMLVNFSALDVKNLGGGKFAHLKAEVKEAKALIGDENNSTDNLLDDLLNFFNKHNDGKNGHHKEGSKFFKVALNKVGLAEDDLVSHFSPAPIIIQPSPVPPTVTDLVPKTVLNTNLDPLAEDIGSPGNIYAGSGNTILNYQTQDTVAFEVGTKDHYRQGDDIETEVVDQFGVVHFDSPGGAQVIDPLHNVSAANANRSADSFDFSFTSKLETLQAALINNDMEIWIDRDPTAATDFLKLHAVYDPGGNPDLSHIVMKDEVGNVIINDSEGTANTFSNTGNWNFYNIDNDPGTAGVQQFNFVGSMQLHFIVREKATGDEKVHIVTEHHLGGSGYDLVV